MLILLNFRCVKQKLVIEIEEYNVSRLICFKFYWWYEYCNSGWFFRRPRKTKSPLREKILYVISFKQFIENADEVPVEHYFFDDKIKW